MLVRDGAKFFRLGQHGQTSLRLAMQMKGKENSSGENCSGDRKRGCQVPAPVDAMGAAGGLPLRLLCQTIMGVLEPDQEQES